MANKRIDEPTGTQTVGHEWDGIEELDTPMPRWWLWTFYLTIIFAIGYVIVYPAWPLLNRATVGVFEWSSRGDLAKDISKADAERQGLRDQLASVSLAQLRADPELMRQAAAGGEAAFKVNCSQCHGSGAAGSHTLGYPNLTDDDWLWGGDMEAIHYSINNGIRQPQDNDKRQSVMPPFAGAFDGQQLTAVTNHVLSLSGKGQSSAVGAQLYTDNCVACHGVKGEGDRAQGAPRLNDAIWLRGSTAEDIKRQILNPKMGAMPAWGERLDPVTVKMLTAYVFSRGGGEDAPAVDPAAAPMTDAPVTDTAPAESTDNSAAKKAGTSAGDA